MTRTRTTRSRELSNAEDEHHHARAELGIARAGIGGRLRLLGQARRIWPNVSTKRLEVHAEDTRWADVTEGTMAAELDSDHVDHLARSIALRGLLVPLIVRAVDGGYELVARLSPARGVPAARPARRARRDP
ncbi:MAG: hypothetical protein M3N47_11385 [Chloroflexota bacterium]|nr:hypothetical protein [Chloroflexota bacterium]